MQAIKSSSDGFRFTFRLRFLFLAIVWLSLIAGWFADRRSMSRQISSLRADHEQALRKIDFCKRKFLESVKEGDLLSDLPEIPVLVDGIISEESEHFQNLFEETVWPESDVSQENCQIYIFDLGSRFLSESEYEGQPLTYYLLIRDDRILRVYGCNSFVY